MKILKEKKIIRKLILYQTFLTATQPTNWLLIWRYSSPVVMVRHKWRGKKREGEGLVYWKGWLHKLTSWSSMRCLGKCHVCAEWPYQECKLRYCNTELGRGINIAVRKYKFLGMFSKYFIPMRNRKYTLIVWGYLKISHLNAAIMGKLYLE